MAENEWQGVIREVHKKMKRENLEMREENKKNNASLKYDIDSVDTKVTEINDMVSEMKADI